MTEHPCKGMSKKQIETFERLATGAPPYAPQRTIDVLLKHGVIMRLPDKIVRDRFGDIHIPVYDVPTPIHMQWCKWCAEQPENAEA